ncbi:HPr family phosphocarrier protein [Candidatus Woesearchaeota archaeon]|nr:HPr family phosphocarrier protein [Candidatus Woesearchaeota archaeon]
MIKNEHGLHIRPAALFAAEANKYKADIYAIKDENEVSAKSIMGIMTLAAEKGSIITLKAKGENAEKALDGLYELCNNGFCEYKTKTGTSLL